MKTQLKNKHRNTNCRTMIKCSIVHFHQNYNHSHRTINTVMSYKNVVRHHIEFGRKSLHLLQVDQKRSKIFWSGGPYDLFIERIQWDKLLRTNTMLPKLNDAYYFSHLLLEITVPRHGTVSGIQRPKCVQDKYLPTNFLWYAFIAE